MQWLMLHQERPDDFVIATGQQRSIREFVRFSAREMGIELAFHGEGAEEYAVVIALQRDDAPKVAVGDVITGVDPRYFRPTAVETPLGDASKARRELGWEPEIVLDATIQEMVAEDLDRAKRHALLKGHGYEVRISSYKSLDERLSFSLIAGRSYSCAAKCVSIARQRKAMFYL